MNRINSKSGFTLVELLITCAVVGVISITLANFTANWLQQYVVTQARTNLLTSAQNGLDQISSDIRLSGSADANNRWPDNNAPGGDTLGWQSSSNTLVLASAAEDNSGNVIFSDPSKYISEKNNQVYFVDSGTLYRRTIASPDSDNAAETTCPAASATSSCPADKIIATNVQSFNLAYYDADGDQVTPDNARSVQLTLTLSTSAYGKTIQASDTTRMVFRND